MNGDIFSNLTRRPRVYEWCGRAARSPLPGFRVVLAAVGLGAAYALASAESESKPERSTTAYACYSCWSCAEHTGREVLIGKRRNGIG